MYREPCESSFKHALRAEAKLLNWNVANEKYSEAQNQEREFNSCYWGWITWTEIQSGNVISIKCLSTRQGSRSSIIQITQSMWNSNARQGRLLRGLPGKWSPYYNFCDINFPIDKVYLLQLHYSNNYCLHLPMGFYIKIWDVMLLWPSAIPLHGLQAEGWSSSFSELLPQPCI